jgi:hypothetical protein
MVEKEAKGKCVISRHNRYWQPGEYYHCVVLALCAYVDTYESTVNKLISALRAYVDTYESTMNKLKSSCTIKCIFGVDGA